MNVASPGVWTVNTETSSAGTCFGTEVQAQASALWESRVIGDGVWPPWRVAVGSQKANLSHTTQQWRRVDGTLSAKPATSKDNASITFNIVYHGCCPCGCARYDSWDYRIFWVGAFFGVSVDFPFFCV